MVLIIWHVHTTKKAVGVLKKLGFMDSEVNRSLFDCSSSKLIIFIAFFVDNNLTVGDKTAINEAIQQ